jgi:hypothetical protein
MLPRAWLRFSPRHRSDSERQPLGQARKFRPLLETLEARCVPTTFQVTTIADGGTGSLRQAILDANNNPGADTIAFAIGTGAQTIAPTSPLPAITGPVTIDGTSQPGFAGTPLIEIDGNAAGTSAIGLDVAAAGSTIQDLIIVRFTNTGLQVDAGNTTVVGNIIGTDSAGDPKLGNLGNGIHIDGGHNNNTIGGPGAGMGNVLAGNGAQGLTIFRSAGNLVQGNFIGTNAAGATGIGNSVGLRIDGNFGIASGNTVNGNVISGNIHEGIFIIGNTGGGNGAYNNLVEGNFVGTNPAGTAALANGASGVRLDGSARNNTVGGTTAAARNIISGNGQNGVFLAGTNTSGGNVIQGNYVGTDVTGTKPLGNGANGINLQSMFDDIVGGTTAGAGNLISANKGRGIDVLGIGATGNLIQGNLIGTNAAGTAVLGNSLDGIIVNGQSANTIGGTSAGAGNIIAGSGGQGIFLSATSNGNVVEGNFIGTDASATLNFGNHGDGVRINPGSNNKVGDIVPGAGNVIANNVGRGVNVIAGTGNEIRGNAIYANQALGIDLGGDGVTLNDSHGHVGPNDNQDFPVLTLAIAHSGQVSFLGTLSGPASTTLDIDLFADAVPDSSGYGQGRIYLGSITVNTDATGAASFFSSVTGSVSPGQYLSATATDASGNTSELSQTIQVHRLDTWTGGGGDGNWSNAANWDLPPMPGDALFFPPAPGRKSITDDLGASPVFAAMVFASPYAISSTNNAPIALQGGILAMLPAGASAAVLAPLTDAAGLSIEASNAGTTLKLQGVVSGAGGMTTLGLGTVELDAANTYTGATVVQQGALRVNGSLTAGGQGVSVAGGATLAGTGNTGPVSVAAGGTLSPGVSGPGVLSAGAVTFSSGASFVVQMNGPNPGTGYDQLTSSGAVDLGDATLSAALGFASSAGETFTLVTAAGGLTGTFNGLPDGTMLTIGSAQFQIHYSGTTVSLTQVSPGVATAGKSASEVLTTPGVIRPALWTPAILDDVFAGVAVDRPGRGRVRQRS